VPSKAMIHAAHQMKSAREARKRFCQGGQTSEPLVADLKLVRESVQASVATVYELEGPDVLQAQGVHVWKGDAVFETLNTLKVTMGTGEVRAVKAKKVCVATGAGPKTPSIKGIEDVRFWNYLNVWDQTVLPKKLAVVGAGESTSPHQVCHLFSCVWMYVWVCVCVCVCVCMCVCVCVCM
jgi:pyruvate/2-oxoglutarate dehydrogenase complex dihydrolipoamide dehydrogenase (E3) component